MWGETEAQRSRYSGLAEDPAAYIVVTLLLGTADDTPLFKEVRSLRDAEGGIRESGVSAP
jgi:hypothetical protein